MTLWEIDVRPRTGQPDLLAARVARDATELRLADDMEVVAARGYLVDGDLVESQVDTLARELFSDEVVEDAVAAPVGDDRLVTRPGAANGRPVSLVHVLLKPGVTDPVAQSALEAVRDFGWSVNAVRTLRKYWFTGLAADSLPAVCGRILANEAIEQVVVGPLALGQLQIASPYSFELKQIPLRDADDAELEQLSVGGQLYLSLVEMRTIQTHFCRLGRDPTDAELETIAQTWSEHCSHKTLAGRIRYRDENGERSFDNMLKETIFAATRQIRSNLGPDDWCVSVFEDNAGIVRFDDEYNVVFKVETHNHPSALEPYGGANTGIGGVIRDPLGTGLGAKPVANTDVFCFAPPATSHQDLPPGVLHPRRVMKGVVAGVRDYGNRMGIPTVNGAIYFDPRYLGNPLVFCGNIGLIPRDKSRKSDRAENWIVVIGGRTGRDGIHGATFSSAELTSDSESLSGGAVQIGNAITEKLVLDVVLKSRDQQLHDSITDCGAGGFSSAVGEMGAEIGAEVWLERAPLKYQGLSYTEIWISEAQERMVLSVPADKWDAFKALCASEGVEATIIGRFVPTGRLLLKYDGREVADLSMEFLHHGRPPVVRDAVFEPSEPSPFRCPAVASTDASLGDALLKILGSLNVASKEWVIRQYDHEVQGGSVVKPLVGVDNDGPSDAAVIRPRLDAHRGLAIACGMNPRFGDHDTYHMAASAIDEAVRNCVAVGADPARIAILDNFCWGYTDRPETLGSLVRAALACRDTAVELGTPFISGKDSLNNEFRYQRDGEQRVISIPPSLLISAVGQLDDMRNCVTMDLKSAGNSLYIVGSTAEEFAGSHFSLVTGATGGQVPRVHPARAKAVFAAVHRAIRGGLVRSCHDLSEGGLAAAVAEMAFAGGLGARVDLSAVPLDGVDNRSERFAVIALFSESNSRFVCEVPDSCRTGFEAAMEHVPCARLGKVTRDKRLVVVRQSSVSAGEDRILIDIDTAALKEAWQAPLRW